MSYGPEQFDENFDKLLALPGWQPFALFLNDELMGMSSFIGIDEARGVLEIGGTYYRPAVRGTGFNERVKRLMLGRAFACGFRRVEFRVDARNGRSQAAVTMQRKANPAHLSGLRPVTRRGSWGAYQISDGGSLRYPRRTVTRISCPSRVVNCTISSTAHG